jgi:ornithine decarboxylase
LAPSPRFVFPTRLYRSSLRVAKPEKEFRFYGPTCDSIDVMEGPFMLPDDVEEGDYIEIGQLGAYGRTMTTKFNGFGQDPNVYYVSDKPLLTLYPTEEAKDSDYYFNTATSRK